MTVSFHCTRLFSIAAAFTAAGSLSACFPSAEDLAGIDLCKGVGAVTTLRITPTQGSLRVGDSLSVAINQFDAKGKDTFLCTSETVTWSSEGTAIALVRDGNILTAMVHGVAPGQTAVRAQITAHAASMPVTVVAR